MSGIITGAIGNVIQGVYASKDSKELKKDFGHQQDIRDDLLSMEREKFKKHMEKEKIELQIRDLELQRLKEGPGNKEEFETEMHKLFLKMKDIDIEKHTDKDALLMKAVDDSDVMAVTRLVKSIDELDADTVSIAQEIAQIKGNVAIIKLIGLALKKMQEKEVNLAVDKVKAVKVKSFSGLCMHDDCDGILVVDNGSDTCTAGFDLNADGYATFDTPYTPSPTSFFPSVVGRPKYKDINLPKDSYIGDDAQVKRSILSLSYPIEKGIITDWEDMEKIWNHIFVNELQIKSENHPVLLTEPVKNPKVNSEKMASVFFETFNVPSMYIVSQPVMSLYASGIVNGTAIEIGGGVAQIAPTVDGYSLDYACKRIDLAGGDISNCLTKLLNDRGLIFLTGAGNDVVRDIKEKHCYVSLDFTKDIIDTKSAIDIAYELPDGNKITISNERFRAPEILFQPSLVNLPHSGIHKSAIDSIMSCDADIHRELFSNIVLSGGSTYFPGFVARMNKEVTSLVPKDIPCNIIAKSERKHLSWIGACIVSTLSSLQSHYVTKEEYDEVGPRIINKKCLICR